MKGNLWIATDAGLDYLDVSKNEITNYGPEYGLPNSFVYGILEDTKNDLWISSNLGLIRYNPEKNTVRYFTIADGLQSNEFNLNAFVKTKKGVMYFGGSNGFNRFFPDSLVEKKKSSCSRFYRFSDIQ
ncbi:MAG: hypothetical protein HC906_04425 [Bacteroidales bacterium]|nr:hypothetical protein [Bacteroidales bacterium]